MNEEYQNYDQEDYNNYGGNGYNEEGLINAPVMPFNNYNHPDIIKWQLQQDETLEIIEKSLRKQKYNFESQKWENIDNVKPVMNETGIFDIITILKSTIHKNFALTNFTKDDIYRICKQIRNEVIINLYLNWKKYDLNKSNMGHIVNLIDRNVFSLLTKSLNDGERKHISGMTHITKTENNAQEKTRNPISALFGSNN